ERTQTAYHQTLKIHETLPVDTSRVKSLQHNKAIPLLANCTELFSISDTYNFIMHPTKSVAIENEMGSVGLMDATVYPLLLGITDNGRAIAAPIVLIDHDRGTFAGARWIFINQILDQHFWNEQGATLITHVAKCVNPVVTELWPKTTYANYPRGERETNQIEPQAFAQSEENWSLNRTDEKYEHQVFTLENHLNVIQLMQS